MDINLACLTIFIPSAHAADMPAIAVVGLQWGDEGKGKITDLLAEKADYVVRFHGGANAGHTVEYKGKTYRFHQLPSGMLHRGTRCIIGNGCVIDPDELLEEMDAMERDGYGTDKLFISDRAHIVMPYHRLLDGAEERLRGSGAIGTTGRGIGPCYSDKASRNGFRMGELFENDEWLRSKLQFNLRIKKAYASALSAPLDLDEGQIMESFRKWRDRLLPHITDTSLMLNSALQRGKRVLFEGAHGLLLDIDHGNYPYVTSSNAMPANLYVGSGVSLEHVPRVIGVLKAYATRVGGGPFPTELRDDTGEYLAQKGGEFGTTTGRKRRCGWLDLFSARHFISVAGVDSIALTKLDVLSGLDEVRVAVGYEYNGKRLKSYPSRVDMLNSCTPVYRTFKGWESEGGERTYASLPQKARDYISFIEKHLGVRIALISTGRERQAVIRRGAAF